MAEKKPPLAKSTEQLLEKHIKDSSGTMQMIREMVEEQLKESKRALNVSASPDVKLDAAQKMVTILNEIAKSMKISVDCIKVISSTGERDTEDKKEVSLEELLGGD
jgi:hypothetical protein